MGAISVEDLFSQITNDVVGNLRSLPLNNKPNELCHGLGHVVLIIQEIDDLLNVGALHIADILAVLVHANLQNVEQSLFEVGDLSQLLVIF